MQAEKRLGDAEAAERKATEEYELIVNRMKEELVVFQAERSADMTRALRDFALAQVRVPAACSSSGSCCNAHAHETRLRGRMRSHPVMTGRTGRQQGGIYHDGVLHLPSTLYGFCLAHARACRTLYTDASLCVVQAKLAKQSSKHWRELVDKMKPVVEQMHAEGAQA